MSVKSTAAIEMSSMPFNCLSALRYFMQQTSVAGLWGQEWRSGYTEDRDVPVSGGVFDMPPQAVALKLYKHIVD